MDKKPDKYDAGDLRLAEKIVNLIDPTMQWATMERTVAVLIAEYRRSSFSPIEVSEDARVLAEKAHRIGKTTCSDPACLACRSNQLALNSVALEIEAFADKRNEAWRDALQALYDEQNGAPLIRHADRWQAAMDKASALLPGRIREAKEGD